MPTDYVTYWAAQRAVFRCDGRKITANPSEREAKRAWQCDWAAGHVLQLTADCTAGKLTLINQTTRCSAVP